MRGYYEEKDEVLARLRRIEDQIKGSQKLVEGDSYCIDTSRNHSGFQRSEESGGWPVG